MTLLGAGTATPVVRFSGAGAKVATLELTVTDDGPVDDGETFTVALGSAVAFNRRSRGTNVAGGADPHGTRNSFDVQEASAFADTYVSFSSGTYRVGEGDDLMPELVLSPPLSEDVTVMVETLDLGGARSGVDFEAGPWEVTVPAGTARHRFKIKTLVDDEAEQAEEVLLHIPPYGHSPRVYRSSSGTPDAVAVIRGNNVPAPTVNFIRSRGRAGESSGTRRVHVRLKPAPASALTLKYEVGGTATAGSDYTPPPGTLSVPADVEIVTIPVAIIDDTHEDTGETVILTLLEGMGYKVGWRSAHTLVILNHDSSDLEGLVQTQIDAAVTNGDTASGNLWRRALAAVRGEAPPNGLAPLTEAEAQAQADAETAGGNAGLASLWTDIASIVGAAPATPQSPSVPEVAIAAGADTVEGGDATFTVTATPAPTTTPLTVDVTVTETGGYATAGTRRVTIPTGGSAVLTVATVDDAADEPDGTVTAVLAAGTSYTVSATAGSAGVAVTDGDATAVTLSAPAGAIVEGGGRKTLTLTLGRALVAGESVTVPLTLGGAAALGSDYTLAAPDATPQGVSYAHLGSTDAAHPPAVTFTGPSATAATVIVAAAADAVDEGAGEQVTVAPGTLEATGLGGGASGAGSVAFAIVEPAPVVVSIAPGAGVSEGADATFTLSAAPAPASALSVTLAVSEGAGSNFVGAGDEGTATVVIPGGVAGATFTVATTDDTTDEPDGSVTVTVNDGNGYTVGSSASGTVSVQDDDLPPPAVSITAAAASVTEGGAASFTVSADRAPDADLTITLSVTEAAGSDHVAADDEGRATVTIAKGATEASFPVATVNDAVDEPDGSVTVTLKDGAGYTVSSSQGAATVSVSDNDAAAGPVLSVADATVTEGDWAEMMPFAVRLSAAQTVRVRVRASTRVSSPVSARPKEDYWPLRSELVTFYPGETEKTVWVYIYNDSHDEDPETFEVVLSDADGATIGDGVAVGTIVNDDPMPAAWLARFGRTVAEQALDGIAARMAAPRTAGMQGSIAGQALSFDPAASGNRTAAGSPAPGGTGALALADVARSFDSRADRFGNGPGFGNAAGSLSGAGFGNGTQSRTMTARDALLGSSFSLTGEADGSGGSMAFWGRAAQGSFDGREGTFSLDGAVITGMLGADYARGKWLVGLALAQSTGEGDYRDSDVSPRPDGQTCPADAEDGPLCGDAVRAGDGSVEASLTAAIPYAALQASERLKLWGAAGYGTGEVTLKTAMGGSYKADTTWSMAAAGLRGDLLAPPEEGSGPALAVTSDALWTRTSSEKTRDLAASDSDATRLRLGLEGSYRMALEGGGHPGSGSGASITPKLEIGARHDGGDAETGFGVELGGGVAWVDPGLGLSLDVSGRTLIAHGNDDLKDRGYAASLAFDPDPATRRGPSLSLRQEFGGQAQGGLDALFHPAALEDRTGGEATSRWSMEAAYGFPAFGGRWTGSPHVGLGLATGARDYSLGWRLTPEAASAPDLSFGLRATRRESGSARPEHVLGIEATARW